MKTSIRKHVTRLAFLGAAYSRSLLTGSSALIALSLLGACNTTEPGVDDYQNAKVDAKIAGKSLADGFTQLSQWDAAFSVPAAPAALNQSTQINVLKKSAALPKRAAGAPLEVDYSDTADGIVTVTNVTPGLLMTSYDTAVIKYDDKWKDGLPDNENVVRFKRVNVHTFGKVETATFEDADDNGIVNAVAGVNNKVKLGFTTSQGGVVETAVLVAGSGPDNDFDAEGDNTLYQAVWKKTKGGALVAEGEYKDGDNDGKVGDNAIDQVVLATWFEMNPAGKPFVKKATATAKVRLFAHQAGDEPVSFSYTEELITGRVNAVSLRNRDGGSDIIKNDTLWVKIETTKSAATDTLQHAEITVVMNPGNDLKNDTDDVCYAFHIKTQKRFGFERSAEFNFVAGEPVPHGEDAKSGSFDGKATYANGQSATLKGSFSPDGFSAEFTGPEGNTVKVEFARSGAVI